MPLKAQSQQRKKKKKGENLVGFQAGPGFGSCLLSQQLLMSCKKKCLAGPSCLVVIWSALPGAGGAPGPEGGTGEVLALALLSCCARAVGIREIRELGVACVGWDHPHLAGMGPTTPAVGVGPPDPFPSAHPGPEGT